MKLNIWPFNHLRRIEERLAELESKTIMYDQTWITCRHSPPRVPINSVVYQLVEHLGLKIRYNMGTTTPARTTLESKEQKHG